MKLFEGFNVICGDLCTPQGFTIDTFEFNLNGLMGNIHVLVADNPCTIAFDYPESVEKINLVNLQRIQGTKGIAQAIIMNFPKELVPKYYDDFFDCVSNSLGLYDDNFLLFFALGDFSKNSIILKFSIQFDICGVPCNMGVSKYNDIVYITTDVAITHDMIDLALKNTFNEHNIKNTLYCVIASGKAGNMAITKCNYIFYVFQKALNLAVMNLC